MKAMNWTQLLQQKIEYAYSTTGSLMAKVDVDKLNWKPTAGSNWMTMGQLLRHITEACGAGCRAFVTQDWGLPPGLTWETINAEQVFTPAEKMPSIQNLEDAGRLLLQDKELALQTIQQAGEDGLIESMDAPWAPGKPMPLGLHFLQMIDHLERHKTQLFFYLKLQGKPVNTIDLWGTP